MDLSYVQTNIDIIPTVIFITDENLNLLYKNNYSRLSVIKTRIGASLSHYVNQADLNKIKDLQNKSGVIVDFVKNSVVSFIVIRYDFNKTFYVLFDAHLHQILERRIYEQNQLPSDDLVKHFYSISKSIFTQCNDITYIEPDRLVSRGLKINHYIRHVVTITKFQEFNATYNSHNVYYELSTVVQMFDLLAKSVGISLNIDINEQEIFVKCNKGDIFLTVLVVLRFAMIKAVDKVINLNVFKYENANYIVVDFSTCLPEHIVYNLISNKDALDEISNIEPYVELYLIKLIKILLRKCSCDLTLTLPGSSLTNLRIIIKLIDENNASNSFHESNWLENQIIELYNSLTKNYIERFNDSEDE